MDYAWVAIGIFGGGPFALACASRMLEHVRKVAVICDPLREIRIPVAFWHSEADHSVPIHHAEYLANLIPHAQLHRLQDYDHTGSVLAAQHALYVFLITD